MGALATLLVSALVLCGCPGHVNPRLDGGPADAPLLFACDTVDILFVIDNSNSMAQEQASLIANFPSLIARVDAIQPPVTSYHVGVVSSDIGAGPYEIGTCKPPGDDGRLRHEGAGAGCGTFASFLEGPAPGLADDFACIASLGDSGCGYEQQMEAALKALTSQRENDGFLRRTAPLAIVFITDEDDCSAADSSLFDPDAVDLGDLKTRCVRLLDKLHPVSRYIDGFKALKPGTDRVVVAAISGPPGEVVFDPAATDGIEPVCSSPSLGDANPGNRFAELVAAFGNRGIQHSICQGDLAPALDVVAGAIERLCLK